MSLNSTGRVFRIIFGTFVLEFFFKTYILNISCLKWGLLGLCGLSCLLLSLLQLCCLLYCKHLWIQVNLILLLLLYYINIILVAIDRISSLKKYDKYIINKHKKNVKGLTHKNVILRYKIMVFIGNNKYFHA